MLSPVVATRTVLIGGMLTLGATGCGTTEPPDAMPICEGNRETLTMSAVTPFGSSGAALVQGFDQLRTGTLTWSGGGSTGLILTLRPDPETDGGAVEYFVPAGKVDPHCVRQIAIPVVIELRTTQGDLRETWRERLRVFATDRATLQARKPAELVQGSVDLSRFVPADTWDPANAQLLLNLEFKASGGTGVLLLETHSEITGSKASAELARF